MLYCDRCDQEMTSRKATPEAPFEYRLTGLPARLIGIVVYQCPKCRGESPIIPNMSDLHRMIAEILVRKPGRLTGEEVKFLRKQIGMPARKFSALIGIGTSHFSRVENGATKHLGPAADKLARVVNLLANKDEAANAVILKLADELVKRRNTPWAFRLRGNRWLTAEKLQRVA